LGTFQRSVMKENKEDYKVVYTVSDVGDLIPCVLRSIESLEKFVSKKNIIVFYTPPRSRENYLKLSNVAVVKEVDNITKPFDVLAAQKKAKGLPLSPRHYGEKVHLCEVECENVLFLDADTVVRKDITELLAGNYDFSALPPAYEMDEALVAKAFASIGKDPLPQFNCGFLIFKNSLHVRIKDLWLKYINDETLADDQFHTKEQWALSLALANVNPRIRYMTFIHNARIWAGKAHVDAYVLHGVTLPSNKRLRAWFGRERKRVLRKIGL